MGFFGGRAKRSAEQQPPPGSAKLGSGRRILSDKGLEAARLDLYDIVDSYGPREYPELPRVVRSGWTWSGPFEEKPTAAFSGQMQDGHPGFVTLRSVPRGTEMGIYDIAGDMTPPLIGHWKQRDKSLTSTGQVEAGLGITAPPVADNYIEELVHQLGLPSDQDHLSAAAANLHQLFVLKAYTFIRQESESLASTFVEDHKNIPLGVAGLRQVLHDLACWKIGVVPYMQDIPVRVRALVLQTGTLNNL